MSEFIYKKRIPELLSPAGSLEAFFAAMEKGADAVYAGLREFSARARAKNFSIGQMERMTAYAHSQGRKLFVTLNTLVKEPELPQLVEILAALESMGVDGVIVQDMAVYRLARDHFPGIPLHASTQMTVHNSAGVRQLEHMGFKRVVLARELHLDDIRDIVSSTGAEIECFIHGALCFSISGQCYFSSFLGGHSGNRGRCAQPCRRQYKYRGKEGYYFSTNDFSSIDMIPELIAAGVSSLKIEGRMKSAEYVARVVEAYRKVLDAPERKRGEAVAEAKDLLKLSFGRLPTKGFLASHNPTDIAIPSLKGSTGRYLGEIKSVHGGRITFITKDRLHVGDRLRVQPKTDMAGKAFTIKEIFLGSGKVMAAKEQSLVAVPSPFPFRVGDTVFKVSSETAFTMSENACLRKLDAVKGGKIPCSLLLAMDGETLAIAATAMGAEFRKEFSLGSLEESRTSDMEGVLKGQFSKTGDTPFELSSLSALGFPAVAIPPFRLKEIRREFYAEMAAKVIAEAEQKRRGAKRRALASLLPQSPPKAARREETAICLSSVRDYHLLHQDGIDALILPVSKANMHQLPPLLRKLKGREENIIWRLPFIIYDQEQPFFKDAVAFLQNHGFRRFEASNISHFQLLKEAAQMQGSGATDAGSASVSISTDYRLFSLNSQALLAWQELGAVAATLYMEDDAENMGALLSSDASIVKRVLAYAPVPVITTRIRIKDVRSDAPVVSDRGEAYTVEQKDGLTTVAPAAPFSLTEHHNRLKELGCASFILDLSALQPEGRKVVLDAFRNGRKIEGSTEFNFTMGLV